MWCWTAEGRFLIGATQDHRSRLFCLSSLHCLYSWVKPRKKVRSWKSQLNRFLRSNLSITAAAKLQPPTNQIDLNHFNQRKVCRQLNQSQRVNRSMTFLWTNMNQERLTISLWRFTSNALKWGASHNAVLAQNRRKEPRPKWLDKRASSQWVKFCQNFSLKTPIKLAPDP